MTKEIKSVLDAYKTANKLGRLTALATVVKVEGSSYRRPGARMLVEDNGQFTGAISGGCLEGDALRKALQAISLGQNKLVTYNTMHEDDVEFGVQLGCNGVVYILFEPISPEEENNPIALLERSTKFSKETVLVTLFSLQNFHGPQPGSCFFLEDTFSQSNIADKELEKNIRKDAALVLQTKTSLLKNYEGSSLSAFIECIQPPVSLVIIGAGNDAFPLVEMAKILGWQVTIVDGRTTHANVQRFPGVNKIITGKPPEVFKQLVIDEWTAFIMMTHNYNYDLAMMKLLLPMKCRYIGTLGPKKRLDRMITELEQEGIVINNEQKEVLHGPTGLDIGAEVSEEIALSVLAEIKAVFANRKGQFLRERLDSIHERSETNAMEK